MQVELIQVRGKKERQNSKGDNYTPIYHALRLPSGRLIFIKPMSTDDYKLLDAVASR